MQGFQDTAVLCLWLSVGFVSLPMEIEAGLEVFPE